MKLSHKTTIAVALFTLNTFLCLAQWQTKHYVDDFGEKTDETFESLVAYGTFSNSATTNSEAMYHLVKDANSFSVNVYEYKTRKATSIESLFVEVKIKTPSGSVKTVNGVLFSKTGALYFSKDKFNEISDVLTESGSYVMVFDRSGKYSTSSYNVKFNID